jgi:hypothetical protein
MRESTEDILLKQLGGLIQVGEYLESAVISYAGRMAARRSPNDERRALKAVMEDEGEVNPKR